MIKEKVLVKHKEPSHNPPLAHGIYVNAESPKKTDEFVLDKLLEIAQKHHDKKVVAWEVVCEVIRSGIFHKYKTVYSRYSFDYQKMSDEDQEKPIITSEDIGYDYYLIVYLQ